MHKQFKTFVFQKMENNWKLLVETLFSEQGVLGESLILFLKS